MEQPAFVLVDIMIKDPVAYETYKALAPASIQLYGGEYAARGGQVDNLEGDWHPSRIVILKFPSMAAAKAWWDSPEYAEAKALRYASAESKMIVPFFSPPSPPPNLPPSSVQHRGEEGFQPEILSCRSNKTSSFSKDGQPQPFLLHGPGHNTLKIELGRALLVLRAHAITKDISVSLDGNDWSTPYRTITKAVSVAVSGDVIYLGNGSYTENGTISINSIALILMPESCDATVSITMPEDGSSIFTLSSSAEMRLHLLTLKGGQGNFSCVSISGASTAILTSTDLLGCSSIYGDGGAVSISSGSFLNAANCSFSGNTAAKGGAISNAGTANLKNCEFSGNTASSDLPFGGAIYSSAATLNIQSCAFLSNQVASTETATDNRYFAGGAIANMNGEATIASSYFQNNSVVASPYLTNSYGGAIWTSPTATTSIFGSTLTEHTANFGAAFHSMGAAIIAGCSFSNNSAFQGGAINIYEGTGSVNCSEMSYNSAQYGAAISNYGSANVTECVFLYSDPTLIESAPGATQISNSTFMCSSVPSGCINCIAPPHCVDTGLPECAASFANITTTPQIDLPTCPYLSPFTSTSSSTTSTTTSSTSPLTSTSTPTTTILEEKTSTSSSISTTAPTTSTSSEMISNCSQSCPTLTITSQGNHSSSSTIWVIMANSTDLGLNVSGSTLAFQTGWGAIREVTPQGKIVKFVDPTAENWPRTVFRNATVAVVTYSTVKDWQNKLVKIALVAVLQLEQSNTTGAVASAKLSFAIEGDWNFTDPLNTLEVDYTVKGAFRALKSCDKQDSYRVTADSTQNVYHFGSAGDSAVALTILRECTIDGVQRSISILKPVFYASNTAVNLTLIFPSFGSSLYYDPNFALLLGYAGSKSCNPVLSWILPLSFMAGAAVLIVVVAMISLLPQGQLLILGTEGARVETLRKFVSEHNIDTQTDLHFPSGSSPQDSKTTTW